MSTSHPPLPLDPETKASPGIDITLENLAAFREALHAPLTLDNTLNGQPFTHKEHLAPSPNGSVKLSVFTPEGPVPHGGRPGIYFMHMGGMISGNRFIGINDILLWGQTTGAVVVTVEYRLAPEFPFPAALDDSWSGLQWTAQHAEELGFDPARLLIAGQSAGGNLAAVCALRARDAGNSPRLCGVVLDSAMLDDRKGSVAREQFSDMGPWTRGSDETGWTAYLGAIARGGPSVSPEAAPARAVDLSGLPPTFLCVGSAELFRDDSIVFASRLWAAGVATELHIWEGGVHMFDYVAPNAQVSRTSIETRLAWVKRRLTAPPPK